MTPLALARFALVLAFAMPCLADGSDSPQTSFFRANAQYAEGKYGEAIRGYEDVVSAGYDGGNLRFNLGNAYFKAGDVGRAILNYERADSWIPADPDVEANLTYARSLTGAEPCIVPTWATLVFPLSTRMSTWTLGLLSSALLTLFLVGIAVRRLLPRPGRALLYSALACLLLLAVSASSMAYRAVSVELPRFAVVIAEGKSSVRFEPAADGTSHYVAPQGARLRINDTREGWAQVARCDGRRGWIETQVIEEL